MRPVRYLITADPSKTIQPQFDTSLLMAHELLKRGIEVDYCDLFQTNVEQNSNTYLKTLPVQNILFADNDEPCFIGLAPQRTVNALQEYDVVLNRKDPPVDDFFIKTCQHFSQMPSHVVQINNPDQIWRHHEHLLPMRYPDFGAPTFVCESFESFVEAVRACDTEAVCKPHNECSGIGIEFYKANTDETILRQFWEKRKPIVVVQPFLPEIENSGDLRVLIINGVILGQVLRVPKKGSRLANLHQGGHGQAYELSQLHRDAAHVVASDLKQFGIYLIGLDFIGDKLTEVNITSPTALPLINKLMGIQGHIPLIDEIEKLRKAKSI
jgi:glutathione synthase